LLLKAAEKTFAEKGYNGARVAEIAARAGLDKRLIFYYFKSKEGLYAQIMEDFFQRAQPLLQGFLLKGTSKNQRARLERFLETMTEFIYQHRDPIRILFREFLDRGILLDSLTVQYVLPILHIWKVHYPNFFSITSEEKQESDHMLLTLSGMSLFYFLVAPLLEKLWKEDPLSPGHIKTRKKIIQRLLQAFDRF
jgi:TetR/AcrR family transcriptional regulator